MIRGAQNDTRPERQTFRVGVRDRSTRRIRSYARNVIVGSIGIRNDRLRAFALLVTLGLALGSCTSGGGDSASPPTSSGVAFGEMVNTGRKFSDIMASIADDKAPAYFPEARAYVAPYPKRDLQNAKAAEYPAPILRNMERGYIVLHDESPHLGEHLPFCRSSQWFEDPRNGTKFNRVGEKRDGPAPRGMTLFVGRVGNDGTLVIDTSTPYPGVPLNTDTTGQRPAGPACV
jgi:cytochrome b6-f complex iron-sulfur subunit